MAATTITKTSPTSSQTLGGISLTRALIYAVLLAVGIAAALPFIWMLLTSVKEFGDAIQGTFWPFPPIGDAAPTLENYPRVIDIINKTDSAARVPLFLQQLFNSIFVTLCIVVGVVLTSTMAAYAFANLEFPGKKVLFIAVLAAMMIPDDLTLVPRAVMMFPKFLGWYDRYFALTIPFIASTFGIFLLRQFFMQVPKDFWDAAQIDGADHLLYLRAIVLPLARPAIMTVALFTFIWSWNEFRWTQLVTNSTNMRNLNVSLQGFLQLEGASEVQLAMAMAAMVVAPVLILYLLTQRYFTEGVVSSGIKG